MNDTLQAILDKEKIVETIIKLFVYTDQRDWEKVQFVFAQEVLFDMTSLAGGDPGTLTPQQITDAWDEGLKPLEAIHHQTGNYMVKINGLEADACCYATSTHYLPNPSGNNTRTFVGSYDFHLIKREDQWKINLFRFNLKYMDGNVDLN